MLYGLDVPQRLRSAVLDRRHQAGTGPSRPYTDVTWDFGRGGYPAIGMTHLHAVKYCEWMSQKTGRRYRLPTEAEWEYACRAAGGAGRVRGRDEITASAWHRENSPTAEFDEGKTHPVATKRPSPYGVHDMLGNVWEWCTSADGRPVARGGSWQQVPDDLDAHARLTDFARWSISDPDEPKSKWWLSDGNSVGFRVVREE
jgi:formylglycine-generating enzyme required for sulfatase activity